MDNERVLKAIEFLNSKECLKGDDKVWFHRLIQDETLTLYLESGDLHVASIYDDNDFEYTFNVTVNDIFETILRELGVKWEYA